MPMGVFRRKSRLLLATSKGATCAPQQAISEFAVVFPIPEPCPTSATAPDGTSSPVGTELA